MARMTRRRVSQSAQVDLLGPRAKVRRAREYLRGLDEALAYDSPHREYEVTFRADKDGNYILDLTWDEHRRREWSVTVGDIAHNLRSALDQAICSLTRFSDPEDDCSRTQFPIRLERARDQRLRGVERVRREALAIVERHQPHLFERGPAVRHPLWQLHVLSNRDKHRELAFFGGLALAECNAGPADHHNWQLHAQDISIPVISSLGAAVALRYVIHPPTGTVEMRQPTLYIAFAEPSDLYSIDVLLSLEGMTRKVEEVLSEFEAVASPSASAAPLSDVGGP